MDILFDYSKDQVVIDKHTFPLDTLREFLIVRYPALVEESFIRVIRIHGKKHFCYDWQSIFKEIIDNRIMILEKFMSQA